MKKTECDICHKNSTDSMSVSIHVEDTWRSDPIDVCVECFTASECYATAQTEGKQVAVFIAGRFQKILKKCLTESV